MNDKKESNKVGTALGCIWIVGAMYATIFVVEDILQTVYGPDFGYMDDDPSILISILLPIIFIGIPGLLISFGDSPLSVDKRIINGITWICSFYAITVVIAGVIDCLYLVYKLLKYGKPYSVSTLVWLERGFDISVTWIGVRNIFSEIPVFLTFIVFGGAGLAFMFRWVNRN